MNTEEQLKDLRASKQALEEAIKVREGKLALVNNKIAKLTYKVISQENV